MRIKRDFIGMFDVMKGILMLLIVLVHQVSFSDTVMGSQTAAVLQNWMKYSVTTMALFFIVSGYGMRREEDLKAYVKRQARQLLLPYLILMFVCAGLRGLLFLALGQFRIQEVSTIVLGFLYGANRSFELFGEIWVSAVGAFWFLLALFFSGLFRQLLWRIRNPKVQTVVLWALVVGAVSFPPAERFQFPWCLVQSCTALGYLEVGRLLKERKLLFRKLHPAFVILAAALWVGMHWCSTAQMGANLWPFWMLDYFTAAAFSVVLLWLYLRTGLAAARFTGLLSYIGRYSLYFLWLHGTEMLVFPWDPTVRPLLLSLHLPGWVIFWSIFLIRVAFSLAGCAVISHIHGRLGQRAALRRSASKEEVR